jgi:hypothetical protein
MTLKNSESSIPSPKSSEVTEPWPCDWDAHELQQLRRGANRSFRENLIWLEHATEFAEKFSKAPSVKHPGFPKVLPKK